ALEEFADGARHPDKCVDRWINLAGTSAGAIIAAHLACGHAVADTVKLVKETDFAQFEDWGAGGELLGGTVNLAVHHGLAHGKAFLDWFRRETRNETFGDIEKAGHTLKLIAADITRREMLVLPDSLSSYRLGKDEGPIDPLRFRIADAVRMSMS